MPHFLGDILVVNKEELVPLFYKKLQSLQQQLYRYKDKDYGPKRAMLGGNGRELLVQFDTLPKKIQKQLHDPRKLDHILENYYKTDDAITRYYTDYQFEDGEYLSMDAQDKHITNATVLQAVVKLEVARRTERLNKSNPRTRGINKTLWADAMSFIKLKEDKDDAFKCTLPKTYARFMGDAFKPFKKEGPKSIIKKYKSNDNARKVRKSKEEKIFNDLFSAQEFKPNATDIARQYEAFLTGYTEIVNQNTGEVYDPKGYRSVDPRTIATYLTKWENEIGTHAKRSGDRQKLMGAFSPHHSFELPTFAGSLLSIDDRQPPFEYLKGKRLWFYIGIDVGSGAFTAVVWGKSKEGIILDFYRQLVRNYHEWKLPLPDALEAESSLNSSYKNTFLREGSMFQNVRIEANNARGKIIERRFGTLRNNVEKKRIGWIARPFAKREANQSSAAPKKIIPYDELAQQCIDDLSDWNNSPHHSNDKITKFDYFINNQHPELKPTNYKAIIPHLGFKTPTSCNVGNIRLQSKEFILGDNGIIFTGEDLIRLMKKVEGQNVDIYWLDDNNGEVFKAMVFMGNQYICEAIAKPKPNRAPIERTPEDNENFKRFASYKNTIDAYQRIRKNELEPVAVINEKPKTLNNNFVMPQMAPRITPRAKPAEAFVEVLEDDDHLPEYEPQENTGGGWRSNFN